MIEISSGSASDFAAVRTLLTQAGLPVDGFDPQLALLVARRDGVVIGAAALEEYRSGALLRSVVVAADGRGSGVGRRLTTAALDLASRRGHHAVYLLTTTAAEFFPRFGFVPIARASVPADVQASVEFTSACPASATVMALTDL